MITSPKPAASSRPAQGNRPSDTQGALAPATPANPVGQTPGHAVTPIDDMADTQKTADHGLLQGTDPVPPGTRKRDARAESAVKRKDKKQRHKKKAEGQIEKHSFYTKPLKETKYRSRAPKRDHRSRSVAKEALTGNPNRKDSRRLNTKKDTIRTHRPVSPSAPQAHRGAKRGRSSSLPASHLSVPISESSNSHSAARLRKEKLSRELRRAIHGRGRFCEFDKNDFLLAVDIFFESGYYKLESIRRMQENSRTFFIGNLRKRHNEKTSVKGTRLILELLEISQARMENATGPRIEEVLIPREMKNGPLL